MQDKIVIIHVNHPLNLLTYRFELLQALRNQGFSVHVLAPHNTQTAEQLAQYDIKYIDISLKKAGISPLSDFFYFLKLIKILRSYQKVSLLNFTIKPVIYGSLAAIFFRKIKVFSVITGLGYVYADQSLKRKIIRGCVNSLYRIAFLKNRVVFFQNSDDRKLFLKKKLLKKSKVKIIAGSGVNLTHFNLADFPQEISFLMIARLLKDKGIIEYLAAAKILKEKYPQIQFKLLGGWAGEDNPAFVSREQLSLYTEEKIVKYLSPVSDVRPIIASASVYVLPSYREGMPRSVLEAMAMGRPVVTSNAPGCRETVVHAENGFLVPIKNESALAHAMEKFILNPDLIPTMGKKSRQFVENRFDVNQVNEHIIVTLLSAN